MRSIAKVLATIGVEVDVGLSELMQLCQLELNGLKAMTAVMESLVQLASQVRCKLLEEPLTLTLNPKPIPQHYNPNWPLR